MIDDDVPEPDLPSDTSDDKKSRNSVNQIGSKPELIGDIEVKSYGSKDAMNRVSRRLSGVNSKIEIAKVGFTLTGEKLLTDPVAANSGGESPSIKPIMEVTMNF